MDPKSRLSYGFKINVVKIAANAPCWRFWLGLKWLWYAEARKRGLRVQPKAKVGLLLELGADPNAPGYRVKPLQIAVAFQDYHTVDLLLAAGAVSNDVGDASFFFNILCGYSPLQIIRHVEDFVDWDYDDTMLEERERLGVENLLLEHGARIILLHSGS
ncbi:hypothetical protein OIDMADRAFT_32139 [Oidiodendron maius Zn]|uniref:Ankyrin repeat protein n=1 Tax=Oidiodendron maius (strain Zn) TaxID=913774 RepID=A0A0C3H3U6_OIDMZ|nr:hypothetical protein OIDMADRAFT_32139 [Oidiodendron maius Zn]